MGVLIKACAVAVLGCAAVLIVSGMNSALAFGVRVATVIALFFLLLPSLSDVFDFVVPFAERSKGAYEYASILLRALGVGVLAHICSGVCRDCGQATAAGVVETVARVEIFVLCIPLIEKILECSFEILDMA